MHDGAVVKLSRIIDNHLHNPTVGSKDEDVRDVVAARPAVIEYVLTDWTCRALNP